MERNTERKYAQQKTLYAITVRKRGHFARACLAGITVGQIATNPAGVLGSMMMNQESRLVSLPG